MAVTMPLRLSSFNCRSVKSSVVEVKQLCDMSSVVMLQEHWLLPHELSMLSVIHPEFVAVAKSSVNVTSDILRGRPYGGTAILYRKDMAASIVPVATNDPRVCAVSLTTAYGPVLFICVYMPSDTGDLESTENYIATCAYITALCEDSDATQYIIAGDFNCDCGSRFYPYFQNFIAENDLCMSDYKRLAGVSTYCNDAGTASSWIDHVLCSPAIDGLLCDVDVREEFVSSDHKPLTVVLDNLVNDSVLTPVVNDDGPGCGPTVITEWSKADDLAIVDYQRVLDDMLRNIDIPISIYNEGALSHSVHAEIDRYYECIMSCIKSACIMCLPTRQPHPVRDYVVPGWNDIVSDKHRSAREAFLVWAAAGKPRTGSEHWLMKRTRSQFKLALRYCKQHEDVLRANMFASSLADKDYINFWKHIRKISNDRSTVHATCVGGSVGASEVTDMWMKHYQQLYNSVSDNDAKDSLLARISDMGDGGRSDVTFTVKDVVEACASQKTGKAVGLDRVAMEALMFGGFRLQVHLCVLFNLFIKHGYVPTQFMKCVIIPLVKCKTGDLSNVDNYRAIAISTSISKVFENVLSVHIKCYDHHDAYQFGFTSGSSTSLCTDVLKQTVNRYTHGGSHVFASFLDFSKAFDKVSYWKLFHKLLDDEIDVGIVRLLAFWYSHQQACIRWHDRVSAFFALGNGTRQGGVLSPWLFARYVRDMLACVVNSGIGCNVGGMFINILAYADDVVLLAPSWRGLQQVLDIVVQQCGIINMSLNTHKSMCMVFPPRDRSKVIMSSFPEFCANGKSLRYVSSFKYLGHIISSDANDDADIQREVSNMFVRTNILSRKFLKCSIAVKSVLFRSYCICFYDAALWSQYHAGIFNKLRSAYNRCIKIFFGFNRRDSLTNILVTLGLPSFDTVMANAAMSYSRLWNGCSNRIVMHLRQL